MPRPASILMDRDEFVAIAARLRVTARAPVPAASVREAARLVTDGVVVSTAGAPPEPAMPAVGLASGDRPQPYALSTWAETVHDWEAVNHRLELDVHGAASMTHIDALDHFRAGHAAIPGGGMAELGAGTVTPGVLVDVPGVLGTEVPAGHVVTMDDVARAVGAAGAEPRQGDAIYLRFGRTGRCSHADLGDDPMPGLSIECADWLAALRPAAVVTDAGLDPNPSEVDGVPVPWHVLLLTSLGVPLVDMAELGALARTCADLGRYEFASVLAPLPLAASGAPVNPLALF